jgi:hypothetical protein
MTLSDSVLLSFIGVLVGNILYQSTILQKIYNEISHIKSRLSTIEEKYKGGDIK